MEKIVTTMDNKLFLGSMHSITVFYHIIEIYPS